MWSVKILSFAHEVSIDATGKHAQSRCCTILCSQNPHISKPPGTKCHDKIKCQRYEDQKKRKKCNLSMIELRLSTPLAPAPLVHSMQFPHIRHQPVRGFFVPMRRFVILSPISDYTGNLGVPHCTRCSVCILGQSVLRAAILLGESRLRGLRQKFTNPVVSTTQHCCAQRFVLVKNCSFVQKTKFLDGSNPVAGFHSLILRLYFWGE